MNLPLRHKKSYNREMRSKTTDDVLSLDSDSDFETGHMESLDLSDNEHLMVIAIDFGTTCRSTVLLFAFATKLTTSKVLGCRLGNTIRLPAQEH